jgi:cysteine synthase
VAAATDIVRRVPGAHVVAVGCDTGTRYLSEPHRWRGS